MRYSFVSAAILALSSSVFAQTDGYNAIVLPIKDQKVAAGKPFEIVWQPGQYKTGTASITLLQGKNPDSLQLGEVIATGVQNSAGKYTWDVPASVVGFATYGFKISKENDPATPADESVDAAGKPIFQYSFPFHITAADGSSSYSTGSGDAATTTIKIGTGPAYTPPPTATPSANSTSSSVATSTQNTTIVEPTQKPSSNFTLTTAITSVRPTASTTGPSGTTTTPAQQSANAGVANAISGSLALIGGVVLAFAL